MTMNLTYSSPTQNREFIATDTDQDDVATMEKIFATPGIGPYFVDAAFNRDYFLVMGIVVLYSAFLLVMNLLVDVAYGLMDPRIRYS